MIRRRSSSRYHHLHTDDESVAGYVETPLSDLRPTQVFGQGIGGEAFEIVWEGFEHLPLVGKGAGEIPHTGDHRDGLWLMMSKETWEIWLKLLLGITEQLFTARPGEDMLGHLLASHVLKVQVGR